MEVVACGQVLNAFGGKNSTQTNGYTILGEDSFFRRRRFEIARSAQLQFFIFHFSFFIYNLNFLTAPR